MQTVTLKFSDETNVKQIKMLIAGTLFEKGVLSSGQAAELVGISKRAFLETIGQFGFSIFGETVEDIKQINDLEI